MKYFNRIFLIAIFFFNVAFGQDWVMEYFKKGTPPAQQFLDTILYAMKTSVGTKAPNVFFERLEDGRSDSLSAYRGNLLVVNLWQAGCIPCIKELPDLEKIHQTYLDRGIMFLYISPDEKQRQFKFLTEKKISLTGIKAKMPHQNFAKPFQAMAIPTGFVIDQQGIIRDWWFGEQSYEALQKKIELYVAVKK